MATTTTYVVRSGDTLIKIAQQFNTTPQRLLAINPQVTNPNLLITGQIINIPPKSG